MDEPKQFVMLIDARELGAMGVFVVPTGDDAGLPSTAALFASREEAIEWHRDGPFNGKCPFCLMDIDEFEWDF